MVELNNGQERFVAAREAISDYLGIVLRDTHVKALLEGKSLSLSDLIKEYSLVEVGNTLIRMDTLAQISRRESLCRKCPTGYDGCFPVCWPTPHHSPEKNILEINLHPDWFDSF